MTQHVTALLPMKANSERVKNKNLKNFAGKPLYHHVLDALDKCDKIDRIAINTDSTLISAEAPQLSSKVIIIDRPARIQGGMVPMNDIIAYDLNILPGEHFLQTHSTNPLVTANFFSKGVEQYFSSLENHDSLFSVTKLQTRLYDKNIQPVNHNPNELLRTQDLPPLFEENSNFYIFSKSSFEKTQARIGTSPQMIEIDKLHAVDIDTPEDFAIAEALFQMLQNKKQEDNA